MTTIVPEPNLSVALNRTRCAVCGTIDQAQEVYPARLDLDAFTPARFSARRIPDRTHHRIVRCSRCGLLRSDPMLDPAAIETLYRSSAFNYGDELEGLCRTYGNALDRIGSMVPSRDGLLDIGCGNGFVLSLALDRGWKEVRGVEPSSDSVARAPSDVRRLITEEMMRPGLFRPGSFDAITLFQVLDHITEPRVFLRECLRLLRPGGVILALNHNASAWSARVLGERSPIVDIEHSYLYSAKTMRSLFVRTGFDVLSVYPVANTYSAAYVLHLVPLPRRLKDFLMPRFRRSRVGQIPLTLRLGNLCLLATPQ